MAPFDETDLLDLLRERFGDRLRSVGYGHRRETAEVLYVREDLEERVTEEAVAAVVEEFLMESFGRDVAGDRFGFGPLQASVRAFEATTVVFLHVDEFEGVFLSVDGGVFDQREAFVQECLAIVS